MRRFFVAMGFASLSMGVGGATRAEGIMDTVKEYAAKPEVQAAAKNGATKAAEMVKNRNSSGTAKPGTTGATAGSGPFSALEGPINTQLLAEAQKNQCSFKTGSDVLEPGCDAKAGKLANAVMSAKMQLIRAHVSGFKFEVSGHTDSRGNAAANKALSEKRAAVMVKQLVAKGVPPSDIVAIGLGSEKPLISPDNTAAKQAQNRRYEVRVRL